MLFGVSNAPGLFMEYMNKIFHPYLDQFVGLFIDDILVYSKLDEDHAEHLRVVLHTLQDKKLCVKLSKCEFWLHEVSFLGHMISSGGIMVDYRKLMMCCSGRLRSQLHKLEVFLGLAGYYRRFIEGFSNLAFPSTRKGQAYIWYVQCDDIFQELKRKMTSALVLILLGPIESFVVYCDASKMGLDGMLFSRL